MYDYRASVPAQEIFLGAMRHCTRPTGPAPPIPHGVAARTIRIDADNRAPRSRNFLRCVIDAFVARFDAPKKKRRRTLAGRAPNAYSRFV
ncbi:MAG TPA: hypothetical protein VGU03_14980 [Frateuria sp.]|uniref:hypothetical protein n=1 Tax=Frateuria sp. TaxID=2211372 RepID=UPI002DF2AC23|nr:hypothetical protein [Frateuria sp.]